MESKLSLGEFKELTKNVPDDYMIYFSLDNSKYYTESFEINVAEKKIIIK